VPDLNCEVQGPLLEVADLEEEDLRSDGIPPILPLISPYVQGAFVLRADVWGLLLSGGRYQGVVCPGAYALSGRLLHFSPTLSSSAPQAVHDCVYASVHCSCHIGHFQRPPIMAIGHLTFPICISEFQTV